MLDEDESNPLLIRDDGAGPSTTHNTNIHETRFVPGYLNLLLPLRMGAPSMTSNQWTTLHLVGFSSLLASFAATVAPLNMVEIREQLQDVQNADHSQTANKTLLSVIGFGSLMTLLVCLFADTRGRRGALLFSVFPFALAAVASAAVSTITELILLQFVCRMFCSATLVISQVMVTEEFDSANRGWGIGALGAYTAAGYGLALVVFGAIGNDVSSRWRIMCAISGFPLLFGFCVRSFLTETSRYKRQNVQTTTLNVRVLIRPLSKLIRDEPALLTSSTVVAFFLAFSTAPATNFLFHYLQEVHSISSAQIGLQGAVIGCVCIFAYTMVGIVSDRHGRRLTIVVVLVASAFANFAFFLLPPTAGSFLQILWLLKSMDSLAISILFGALGCEMFSTPHRSTARGVLLACMVVGDQVGMAVESVVHHHAVSHWVAAAGQALLQIVVIPSILMIFPETAGVELEEISSQQRQVPRRRPVAVVVD